MIDHQKHFDILTVIRAIISLYRPVKPFQASFSILGPEIGPRAFFLFFFDHLPVKPFPMIDHLTAKLIQMSDHLTAKTMSMYELSLTENQVYIFY